MVRHLTAVVAAALCLLPFTALAQSSASVLVVANESSPDGVRIAETYMARRAVPADQLVRLATATTDEIDRASFERTIQRPISEWLTRHAAQDRILYIVLTRGMPLRIRGTAGRQGTMASVDSELALLYRRMTGATVPVNGPVANPYFAGEGGTALARPFTRADHDIYLVTRLDGFSTDDALALVDRGAAPASGGVIVLDAPSDMTDPRNLWLSAAAERLAAAGHEVAHDTTSRALQGHEQVVGYFSWGSDDPALRRRAPGVTFAPGALAGMFLSAAARTFTAPPAEWVPGQATSQGNHAGSRQSLIGDLIAAGATGVAGAVAEPFMDGAVRPDILFPAYVGGAALAEAFYRAIPHVGWQTVVVGDPLCAPFRARSLTDDEAAPPLDPETELPAQYSARRLAALAPTLKAPDAAIKWLLRAEARRARDDRAGTIEALQKAVEIEPPFLAAWRQLGVEFEAAERHAEAHASYRRVIELDRNDILALNNLAYGLAVREHQPEEALGLAQRAATLAKGNPTVNDTLGWIQYLLGNTDEALRLILPAAKALPGSADVQFHAAVVLAAVGRLDDAERALQAALQISDSVRERREFEDLQLRLKRGKQPSA
jgi:uncharacterized protein (TIGR03790 family)